MDSPPYHYYHHYDPTLINTHTLLKPQAYQQQTSINTHISPEPTYPNFISKNSPHYLIHHSDSITQQLLHSQRACIHAISKLASDISTLNNNLTPPHFTYQQPIITSTTIFNHNFNQHSHNPFPPPKSTPFNHHNFTYSNTTTHFCTQPVNSQTFVSPSISTHTVTPTIFTPPPLKISTHPNKHSITSQIPPYNSNHVTTEIDAAMTLVSDFPIHSDPAPNVVDEQHVFVAKDFNDEAPSKLVLDFTSTFSTRKTDERSSYVNVTVKDLENDNHRFLPSISQSPGDSDRVEYLIIQSIVDVPIGLVPAKHRSITTTRPSLLPYRFTIITDNDGRTLFRETKQQVLNHELSVNNFERSFDFPVVCTFNFDPGGDKYSPAANYGGIFSLLLLPWDRGKFGVGSFLSPASDLSGISSTPSISFLWEPWDRGKEELEL